MMMRRPFTVGLLAGTVLAGAAPAHAQTQADIASELASMKARVEQLEARLREMEKAPASAQAPAPAAVATTAPAAAAASAAPSWKGAPQFTGSGGWSFKPRGRLQYDVGLVERPQGVVDRGLGFGTEVRRARLGVEGTMPGGFGYVFEADFADNDVEITDALLSYAPSKSVGLTVGQHNPFQSLEELTSSRFTTFIERAAFTDAFRFERRVGLSAVYTKGDLIAQAGAFSDNIGDLTNDENNSAGVDGRLVYAPKMGDTQLHLGGSAHYRSSGSLDETGTRIRYRQRPLVHTTDTRFISTPALSVDSESHYGFEAAAIRGPIHAAGELHWLRSNLSTGTDDPRFFGGYAEVGYYLTGETRGYKGGRFDRTKVLKPVGGGGLGAFQINLRYDHLDLNSGMIRGGTQDALLASLIWIPQDYVRFLINYGRLKYRDAAVPTAGGDRDYTIDVLGVRAQVDF
jgi:phosphate-selective porin OprO/OprP